MHKSVSGFSKIRNIFTLTHLCVSRNGKFTIGPLRECLLVVGRGSWVPSRGSWVPSRGSWVPSRGSWVPSRGSRVVGRGLLIGRNTCKS